MYHPFKTSVGIIEIVLNGVAVAIADNRVEMRAPIVGIVTKFVHIIKVLGEYMSIGGVGVEIVVGIL